MILTIIDELQNLNNINEDIIVICKETDTIPISLLNKIPKNCEFKSFPANEDLYKTYVLLYIGQLLSETNVEVYNIPFLNNLNEYESKNGYKISLNLSKNTIKQAKKGSGRPKKENVKQTEQIIVEETKDTIDKETKDVDKSSLETKETKKTKETKETKEVSETEKTKKKPILITNRFSGAPEKLFDKLKDLSTETIDLVQYKFLIYDSLTKSSSSKTLESKLIQNLGEEKAKSIMPLLKANYIELKSLL